MEICSSAGMALFQTNNNYSLMDQPTFPLIPQIQDQQTHLIHLEERQARLLI
jgi:hypothetical protein